MNTEENKHLNYLLQYFKKQYFPQLCITGLGN